MSGKVGLSSLDTDGVVALLNDWGLGDVMSYE